MKHILVGLILISSIATLCGQTPPPPNRQINYTQFLKDAVLVDQLRSKRRITEDEFISMASESGTLVLDARSDAKYKMLHVKGAIHLSLPDFTAAELAKIIPSKDTRVLIYCNNNFKNEPVSMPGKAAGASLNIYTFNSLYAYGYTNIYELGPLLDINQSRLIFEGSLTPKLPLAQNAGFPVQSPGH